MLKVSVQCQIPRDSREWVKKTAGRHMYICMYECINVCVCVSMAANVVPQVRYYKSRRKEDGLKSLFLNSSPDFLLLHVFMMSRCHG